jgi:hypothetical protein
MEIVGHCRLCLKQGPLRDSHFIPQAAYKRVRGEGRNTHPLVIQTDGVVQTSVQMRAHLLCHDCEQLLSKNGENTFFRNCYWKPGEFRLLEILRRQEALFEDDQFSTYVVPEFENSAAEQIGYMGLSVLWKSAAHSWKDREGALSISLGSPYQEQVRRFLLKEGPFLAHGAMVVEVSDENNRMIAVIGSPATLKLATHYMHSIDICGIRFKLFMGSRMPSHMKQLCVFKAGRKVLLLAKKQEAAMASLYHEHLKALVGRDRS